MVPHNRFPSPLIAKLLVAVGGPLSQCRRWLRTRMAGIRAGDLADQAELERSYLDAAVNNMPIGLVMFDSGKRLIICNDQYRTMYGFPREVT